VQTAAAALSLADASAERGKNNPASKPLTISYTLRNGARRKGPITHGFTPPACHPPRLCRHQLFSPQSGKYIYKLHRPFRFPFFPPSLREPARDKDTAWHPPVNSAAIARNSAISEQQRLNIHFLVLFRTKYCYDNRLLFRHFEEEIRTPQF
ncbi:MAG: hypothetical protein JRJ68_13540, partial [Deltaproteobacteria bacterium]|nr:hypothetical protein [Deltaproteobacteria bacterium]